MPKQLYGGKKKLGALSGEHAAPQGVQEASHEPSQAPQSDAEPFVGAEQARSVEMADVVLPSRPVALAELPLDVIIPSRAQAREQENLTVESLQGLVASMQEHGILSRIRVRQVPGNDELFELVFGERRWRAAQLAGFTHYPVEIAPYTDDELEEVGLIENIQRQDLTPLEEARKYQRLLALRDENGLARYSLRKLAGRIGKDKSYIEMRLAVLRTPENVQQLVREQPEVPLRSAYEVGKVEDPEKREEILADIREGRLQKVEEVKTRVREATGWAQEVPPSPTRVQPSPSSGAATGVPQQAVEPERLDEALTELPASSTNVGRQQEEPERQSVGMRRSSLEAINASVDSKQALVLFEQQLQEDNAAIVNILYRLAADTAALTAAQREVLILYIDRWGKALMDLKSHTRPRGD